MKHISLALFALVAGPAAAQDWRASPWTDFREASIRLLLEAPTGDAHLRGALEIRLMRGYKTYWRQPGDTGVPPAFDFSKTTGLGPVRVDFPFPTKFDDGAGGTAFGYVEHAILPFEASRTGTLGVVHLKLDFAVCGTMCIPLSGELALDPAQARLVDVATRTALEGARKRIPRPLAAEKAQAMIEIMRDTASEKPRWIALFRDVGNAESFHTYPEGKTYLSAAPAKATPDGRLKVALTGDPPRAGQTGFGSTRLTFGSDQSAYEVTIDLDANRVSP